MAASTQDAINATDAAVGLLNVWTTDDPNLTLFHEYTAAIRDISSADLIVGLLIVAESLQAVAMRASDLTRQEIMDVVVGAIDRAAAER